MTFGPSNQSKVGDDPTLFFAWRVNSLEGARVYYMRNIMHDYPDNMCIKLLKNTIAAMNRDSVILIDDMVLPNKGLHWQASQLDLTMMSSMAAMERTEKEWYTLLDMAGLKIKMIYPYTEDLNDSIIVAVPK